MNKPDGGQAFPCPSSDITYPDGRRQITNQENGMSLRQWFAGQIVQGFFANCSSKFLTDLVKDKDSNAFRYVGRGEERWQPLTA